jgi:hypothetical protein
MAGRAVLTITPPEGLPDGRSLAPTALNLGWRLADLYREPVPQGVHIPPRGGHLPGVAELGAGLGYVILFGQVEAALRPLRPVLPFDESAENLARIRALTGQQDADDAVRRELLDLHLRLTDGLASSDARLGTAYGLGRALFETCHPVREGNTDHLMAAFGRYRLEVVYDWLGQLEEVFPDRTARAVARSLRMWEAWVTRSPVPGRVPVRAPGAAGASGDSEALNRQGDLWRRVLTAEQDPLRLLGPQDYVNAGIGFLVRIRRMVTQFAVQWAGVILLFLAALGAAIWAGVTYASTDAGKLAAVLASLAGSIGLSWKGVGGTLGKGLGVVQKPLWEAEVDAALAQVITKLPGQARHTWP